MKYLLDSNTCIRFLNQRSQEVIDQLTDTPLRSIFEVIAGRAFRP